MPHALAPAASSTPADLQPLRAAVLDDLPRLLAIEEACFIGDRIRRRAMRAWLKRPALFLVLPDHDGVIVAYGLTILHRGGRCARLYSIAVHPDWQGRGLAGMLLRHTEHLLRERGFQELRLEVRNDNSTAISVYRSHGYAAFGQIEDYYHDHCDAIRMRKHLIEQEAG